jgi:NAD(P)-dependent dehydrogenase (short-subunit alcohol dehydrogenase family)
VLGTRRLDGALAIVTGGYTGLGLQTTRALAGAGATVVMPARTREKARSALGGVAVAQAVAGRRAAPAGVPRHVDVSTLRRAMDGTHASA